MYFFKKRKFEAILILFVIVIICLVTILDKRFNVNLDEIFPTTKSVLSMAFPLLLTLLSAFVAISLLAYQLIYIRYPIHSIKNKINMDIKSVYIILSILTSFSIITWVFDFDYLLLRVLIILLVIYSIIAFFRFIFSYRKFDIYNEIQRLSETITSELHNQKTTIEKIEEMMNDVNRYFVDSINKKEDIYVESIIDLFTETINEYISQIDQIKCKSEGSEQLIDSLNEKLIDSLFKNYRYLFSNKPNKSLLNSIRFSLLSSLKKMISLEKISLYEYSLKKIDDNFHISIIENNTEFASDIILVLSSIHIYIVRRESYQIFKTDLTNLICDNMLQFLRYSGKNIEIQYELLDLLTSIIKNQMANKQQDGIDDLVNIFFENTHFIISRDNSSQHKSVWMNMIYLSLKIIEFNNEDTLNLLIDKIEETIFIVLKEQLKDSIYHCAYLIKLFEDKIEHTETLNRIKSKKYIYALKVLEVFPETAFLFIPNYKKIIADSIKNNISIDEKRDELSQILQKLIRIDNSPILYSFLDEVNLIVQDCNIDKREYQERLISLYEDMLSDSLILKSIENFKMILYKFKELVKQLDHNKNLSENLTIYILDLLESVSNYLVNISTDNIAKLYLRFITDMAEDTSIILKKKELREKVVLIIYRLTIESMESQNINLIRICSNSLGWYAKFLFDNGDIQTFKSSIKYAENIYKLAYETKIDSSIKYFIGTLFVIIGSYLYGKKKFTLYEYVIKISSRLPEFEILFISKKLREDSSQHWDKTLGIDSKSSMNHFISDLKKNN